MCKIEPKFRIEFEVIAYEEGGYGDNRSKKFTNEKEAIDYARSLEPRFGATVVKRISMETITIKIDHHRA